MDTSKLPDLIRRRFNKIKENFSSIETSREVNRNLYRGVLNVDDSYEWDYSLSDPQVFPIVRNYLSRSNPSSTKIQLDPRRPEDVEKTKVNQQFVNWEIGEIMLTSLFYRMFFSGFVAGRGYAKTGWKYEPAVKILRKDEKGNVIDEKIIKDIVNRADARFVRFNDLLIPNRNNPFLHEQPYVIELIQMRVGEMVDENESLEEKGEKPYWNKKWLEKLRKSGVEAKLLDYQVDMATDADSTEDIAFKSAYVPLMCMQTLDNDVYYMPITGDDTIVNDQRFGRYWHGHYPYIDFCPFPEDDEYYSLALIDVIGDLQIASTEVLNQTLTNIRQINNDMWVAGSLAAQTPDWQFTKRPSGIIRVAGDPSQIQQIRTQDNTRAALTVMQEIANKSEKAGGISSLYSSGVANQSVNQTARGAQIIDQNIDINMRMIVDLFGEQVIKRLGEHCLELNAQYVTEEQIFYVTGRKNARDFVSIDPAMISANFDVSVNSERMIKQTPASRQASLQNFMAQLIQAQNTAGIQVDIVPVVEALADSYPEMENVDEVVISVDEKSQRDISLLERGQMPEIKVRDSHKDLITAVNVHYAQNEAFYPEEIKQVFEDYFMAHMKYIQTEKEVNAMSQPVMPQATQPQSLEQQMQSQATIQGTQTGLPGQGYNLAPL